MIKAILSLTVLLGGVVSHATSVTCHPLDQQVFFKQMKLTLELPDTSGTTYERGRRKLSVSQRKARRAI